MQDFYGKDKIDFILVNQGGHDKYSVAGEADCIERYGMEGFHVVRYDNDEYNAHVAAPFGQFGYGKFVIDAKGILRAVDIRKNQIHDMLDQLCGRSSEIQADGFALQTKSRVVESGRDGYENRLGTDHKMRVLVELELPTGWHVGGDGSEGNMPTKLSIDYAPGLTIGELELPEGDHWGSPVRMVFPVSAPAGMVIGRHLVHGTLRFVACNDEGCLPPMDVPWKVELTVM